MLAGRDGLQELAGVAGKDFALEDRLRGAGRERLGLLQMGLGAQPQLLEALIAKVDALLLLLELGVVLGA
ncbi:MAG: hypothetical protein KY393_04785 [Actinobacteria bacterium]|nr:hypothetical protein [Actinomycetota bacterium]